MRQRQTYRVGLSAGTTGRGEALRGAACAGLPPEVVDKYLRPVGGESTFPALTGRMICHRCPAREACLAQAIREPAPRTGRYTRGGEPPSAIAQYRTEHLRERTPAGRIAHRVIAGQLQPFRGAYGHPELRAGRAGGNEATWDQASDAPARAVDELV